MVSERDCRDLVADPYLADYVPLYIKLHGTASEPDSRCRTALLLLRRSEALTDLEHDRHELWFDLTEQSLVDMEHRLIPR